MAVVMQDCVISNQADWTVFLWLGMKGTGTKLVNDDMGM